jgi:hypothetical protein
MTLSDLIDHSLATAAAALILAHDIRAALSSPELLWRSLHPPFTNY